MTSESNKNTGKKKKTSPSAEEETTRATNTAAGPGDFSSESEGDQFDKAREKFEEARSWVKSAIESDENYKAFASLAYIPVFGWILPLFFKRENRLCFFHGRQALFLNLILFLMALLVWFLNKAPLVSDILSLIQFHYVTNFAMYITVWGYLGASLVGAVKAGQGILWSVPFLNYLISRSPLADEDTEEDKVS